ncbi:hypothetical protein LTS08_008616 [Lithohypha guttulata]|uniref:uncharacterized protein n=1 Tax=Lithohypha guttulata TaxID=1690604 RepID=UPI002DDF475E|nr:hypothetical protein LTS08_008616 [Lithohypha guttulata]
MSDSGSTMEYSQASRTGAKRSRDESDDEERKPSASDDQPGSVPETHQATTSDASKDQKGNPAKTKSGPPDDGSEPELLDDSSGANDPFPGAGCQTIAKISTARRTLYVNRYGPRRYPWFVMSSNLRLKDGTKEEELPNIANAYARTLDQPIDMADKVKAGKKFGKKDIQGVLGVLWDFDERQNPLRAVESLNPKMVKKGLDSARERREYLNKGRRLPAYPTTYVWVKFTRPINEVVGREQSSGVVSSWELGSKYRSAFGKNHIAREQDLYRDARRQADRFISWYEENVVQDQREGSVLYEEFDREPTVVPRRATSESPSVLSEQANDPDRPLPTIEGKQAADRVGSTSLKQTSGPRKRVQTVLPTPENDSGTESVGGDEGELTELEKREMFLMGFKQQRKIQGDLSPKEKKMFDVAFAAFNMG